MSQTAFRKKRQKIISRMAEVFGESIKNLSMERQEILLEDMITAFENRLAILGRTEVRSRSCVQISKTVEMEALQ